MGTRRRFVRNASILGLASFISNGFLSTRSGIQRLDSLEKEELRIDHFGLQIYTVRDFMELDPKTTLKSIAEYGYTQIESYEGSQGVFWGFTPKDFHVFLRDHGLSCIATHCNSNYALDMSMLDDFRRLADDSASIGMQYLINPWLGNITTIDGFKRAADSFNKLGEITKSAGLRFAYHNHHYSFEAIEGELPQEIMMSNSDPELVDFEMDIYWVVASGHDPIVWLQKHPNRFRLCHIKDQYKSSKLAEIRRNDNVADELIVNGSCVLGEGQIDFDLILLEAQKQGMKHWIVEQERFDNLSSMQAAKRNADFMKKYIA